VANYPEVPRRNFIDEFIFSKLRKLNIVPSPLSSDSEFLRRVCLDVAGTLPPPNRARQFLASKDPGKREKLIETLLNSPEYIDYWTFRLSDLLRVTQGATLSSATTQAYANWVHDSVAQNKSWDQMARERIAHSDYKRIIELSNPSLPGYGIDEQYERSDQRHWTLKCPSCGEWTCLEREFPKKLGEEVRIILPRPDGGFYRACPRCQAELNVAQGEWVAEFPGREIHGYRISQLYSVKIDPGEILEEYRTTRFPERFYNLKIGIPWADLEHKLDPSTVTALCQDVPEVKPEAASYCMGVDTGKELHVVVLRQNHAEPRQRVLVHVAACRYFSELDELITRFRVDRCVIDGLPETHATRDFARAHPGSVFMNFFNDSQRGARHQGTHLLPLVRRDQCACDGTDQARALHGLTVAEPALDEREQSVLPGQLSGVSERGAL
jgi:hypothetical protein